MGRFVLILLILLVASSVLFNILERLGLPHVPGDVVVRRKHFTLYIPVTSAIIMIIVLTALFQWF